MAVNQYHFDIELKPSIDELRPTVNIPPDAPNRPTITEETHKHTTLRTALVQVQYGTYDGKSACLLVLDFRFKFRDGVHRVKSVKIHIDFSSPPSSAHTNLASITAQSVNVANIEPKILLSAPIY